MPRSGYESFLAKPIDPENLKETLTRLLMTREPLASPTLPDLAHINYQELQQRMGNLELDLEDIRQTICQDFEQQIQVLNKAIAQADKANLDIGAHRIRGSALYMCFERVVALTQELEAYESTDTLALETCLKALIKEVDLVKKMPLKLQQ